MTEAENYIKTLTTNDYGKTVYPIEQFKDDVVRLVNKKGLMKASNLLQSSVFMIEAIYKELTK